ncbi:hypothetical protein [Curtobacterium sp. BRD11]|uniref:hypothetical protein n=1 Tax=Curtobacterium sp. BRD11 TaxID=2962581 RepID=UPI002880DA9F|nr:hypothetical protein [Curtobacterium sp. BRD11]MDT0211258.1 hypothetical protein [Curtobacterium sp. BRD11]
MEILVILGYILGLVILFYVVRAAVVAALASHYKTVRWYEATGEWNYGSGGERHAPRDLPVIDERAAS